MIHQRIQLEYFALSLKPTAATHLHVPLQTHPCSSSILDLLTRRGKFVDMPVSSRSRRWLPLSFLLASAVFCLVEQSNASTAAINGVASVRQQQQRRKAQGLRGLETEMGEVDTDTEEENPPEGEGSGGEDGSEEAPGEEKKVNSTPEANSTTEGASRMGEVDTDTEEENPPEGEGSRGEDGSEEAPGEEKKVNSTPEANSTTEGASSKTSPPTPAAVPPAVAEGVCEQATKCDECQKASERLPDEDQDKYICVYGIGNVKEEMSCQKMKKKDAENQLGCSGTEAPNTTPAANKPNIGDGEENSGAMAVKIIGGIVLIICVASFAKSKLSGGGGGIVSGIGAPLSIGKAAKYREV
jgi:hypothetical protein